MNITIAQSFEDFIDHIYLSRSEMTSKTYRSALKAFGSVLVNNKLNLNESTIDLLTEDAISWFATSLKAYSPATERLYLTAVTLFYEFLIATYTMEFNLHKLRLLVRQRSRRPGLRLPQFPKGDILKIIDYAQSLRQLPTLDKKGKLRNLRDRAFILTLADTGLRVHEACALRRGDIDWNEGKAIVIGKGNQQAIIRFSSRAMNAIRDYIIIRAGTDGASGRALASLPVFARHDKGAGNKTKPMTTTTGRNIISQRVKEHLGEDATGSITPHSFRHHFVTTILQGSGGNLKLAQELARHKSISVTQRYAHLADDELDRGYYEVFERDG